MSEEITHEHQPTLSPEGIKSIDESSNDTNEGLPLDEQEKINNLNNNLDDLFSKIAQLTSEMEKPSQIPQIILSPLPVFDESIFRKYESKTVPNNQNINQQHPHQNKGQQQPPENDKKLSMKYFQLGKTIGEGKFGTVHECKHIPTQTIVALKKIYRSSIAEYGIEAEIENEVTILSEINHPNIINLYGFFGDPYHFFIVTEYVPGKTLEKMFKSEEPLVASILAQTLRAVQYLHNKKIVHRDIKPENLIYLDGVVKLLDFGYATYVTEEPLTTLCGTLDYASPQVLQKQPYGLEVDLWALGILTFQLLTGTVPYKGLSIEQKSKNILEQQDIEFPANVSQIAQCFIKSLLKKNPKERSTIEQCLGDPFLQSSLVDVKSEVELELTL